MNKIISFDKTLDFKTMVGEISSISLEPSLKFEDDSTISGNLAILGKYKLTSASRLEEDFSFSLPIDIVLTECLEEEGREVVVDDFRYDIVDDEALKCHIDLKVSGVEKIEIDDEEEDREASQSVEEPNNEMEQIDSLDSIEPIASDTQFNSSINTSDTNEDECDLGLFSCLQDSDDSFSTYYVYIVREGDSISSIIDKYHIGKDDLEKYNDLEQFSVGSKIIIPSVSHE